MKLDLIMEILTDKVAELEKWEGTCPVDAAYDEGYVDGAMTAIELLRDLDLD